MIDAVKTLLNKTNELEDKLNDITKEQSVEHNPTFCCFSKGLINLSFIESNKILVAEFETKQNRPLYFQNQIELNITSSQNIVISLILNDIAIFKTTRKLNEGYNQFTIMKNYIPLLSEQSKLYIKIKAENGNMITILSNTLFIWGLHNISNDIEYSAIETNDKFLLSYNQNNSLFYSFQEKSTCELNSEDFTYYSNAISYSFVYLSNANLLILFRVDLDGNLFYTNFNESNEIYIDSNVSQVSSCCCNDKIIFSFIKDNKCYLCELNNTFTISNKKHIECMKLEITKSYIYFNKYNKKIYLILTDSTNSNYLLQSVIEKNIDHHYLNANYSITYSIYEVNQ